MRGIGIDTPALGWRSRLGYFICPLDVSRIVLLGRLVGLDLLVFGFAVRFTISLVGLAVATVDWLDNRLGVLMSFVVFAVGVAVAVGSRHVFTVRLGVAEVLQLFAFELFELHAHLVGLALQAALELTKRVNELDLGKLVERLGWLPARIGFVVRLEPGVAQRFFSGESLVGIPGEQLGDQVERLGVGVGVQLLERHGGI